MWDWIITNIETLTTIVLGLNVFLCAHNSKWNWPVGLVGVTMYGLSAWFLWQLYADALLQIFYFITGIVGWWYWVKGGENKTEAKITDISLVSLNYVVVVAALGTWWVGEYLSANTDSVVPYMDAYTTVISLIAQIMLMFRIRQAWGFWVAANLVYIYMFHLKGLDQLALLYVAFLANAVYGYFVWTKAKNKYNNEVTSDA